MLSLPKKSEERSGGEPHWHSDFRNLDRLPDTKVVRTAFFVNTASIAIALALLLWAGYREYHIRSLEDQIAVAVQQIESNGRQNREALRLSQIFSMEEKKLAEAGNFMRSPVYPSEFIDLLGQTLPAEISIDAVDARLGDAKNRSFVLRGLVAGTRDQASGSASNYVDALKAHPRMKAIFETVTLDRLNPDGSSGLLSFEITLKIKPEGKK